LHGRVVKRRSVVEMALPVTRNTAVYGRAAGPDPRRQQACARSSRTPQQIDLCGEAQSIEDGIESRE